MVINQKFTDSWKVRKKGTKEIYLVFSDNVTNTKDNRRFVFFKMLNTDNLLVQEFTDFIQEYSIV
jgi:hypothetical protein